MDGTRHTQETRDCEACGASYPRKRGVSRSQFERSRACSLSCATRLGQLNRLWPTLHDRFWSKVDRTEGHGPEGECWVWTGSRDGFGYGRFNRNGSGGSAHRVSYELSVGEIPHGLVIRHKCDNPACVRPDHLETGTDQDNSNDQVARNRQRGAPGRSNAANKLTEESVLAIFADPRRQRDIAVDYGISQSAVMMIKTGRNWGWLTKSKIAEA